MLDGFPIYGPYNAKNKLATPCWKKRDYSASSPTGCSDGARSCVLVDQFDYTQGVLDLNSSQFGPSLTGTVSTQSGNVISAETGIYYQDYYYDSVCYEEGAAEALDAYNGHDHDDLGYHYHVTIDGEGSGVFPFHIGPKYRGCTASTTTSTASTSDALNKMRAGKKHLQGPPPPQSSSVCCGSISVGMCSQTSMCAAVK